MTDELRTEVERFLRQEMEPVEEGDVDTAYEYVTQNMSKLENEFKSKPIDPDEIPGIDSNVHYLVIEFLHENFD